MSRTTRKRRGHRHVFRLIATYGQWGCAKRCYCGLPIVVPNKETRNAQRTQRT